MDEVATKFTAEYTHDGSCWALNFYAKDEADATRKVASIRATLALLGETVAIVPAELFIVPDQRMAH